MERQHCLRDPSLRWYSWLTDMSDFQWMWCSIEQFWSLCDWVNHVVLGFCKYQNSENTFKKFMNVSHTSSIAFLVKLSICLKHLFRMNNYTWSLKYFLKVYLKFFAKFEKQFVLKCNQDSLPFTVGIVILVCIYMFINSDNLLICRTGSVMEQFSVYVRIREFIRFYQVNRILYFLSVIFARQI